MASTVLSFVERASSRQPDWTNAELAELYRVQHALAQAGIAVETDRGVTDEGDPWFVFCRESGDVVVHVARFGGYYRLYSPALIRPLVGPTFSALTKSFVSGLRSPMQEEANVSIHPAALLSVLIATIIYSIDFHANPARASEGSPGHDKVIPPAAHASGAHHLFSELPGKEPFFHGLIASIKALFEPNEGSVWQQLSIFSVVEIAAAAAAMVGFSALIDLTHFLKSEFFTVASADDHNKCAVAGCQNDAAPVDQAKEKANLHIGSDVSDSQVVTISVLNKFQANDDDGHNAIIEQRNNTIPVNVVINDTRAASSLNSALIRATDHQVAATDIVKGIGEDISLNDATYFAIANHSEAAPGSQSSNTLTVAGTNSSANQDLLTIADSGNAISIGLAHTDSSIDLSATAGINEIALKGDGDLQISGLVGSNNPQIIIGAGFTQSVSLSFANTAPATFAIQLNGSDYLSLGHLSTAAASVQLTLDSEGAAPNVVTISDQAVATAKVDITIVGVQDLTLNESAAAFNNTTLDTSGLSGNLTVGLSLDNVFQSVDLSQVDASNFIVGSSGNIALLHAAFGSHIQLGSDLNIVDLTVAGATIIDPGALAIDLNSGAARGVTVNLLDVFYTSSVALNSTGAGLGEANTVQTLTDSSLSTLTITGDSALVLDSIGGPSGSDSQNVTIDAHALTGSLNINVSNIDDTASLGRSIILIGGSGQNILTNYTASESTTFVTGSAGNIINIGGGAISDSIVGLKSVDTVNIGAGTYSDVVINELNLGAVQQNIDAQASLITAAQAASSFVGSSAAQQAVLFSYHGNVYVFIDATGSHLFDASHDAIIKLAGIGATPENLTGVFHSAS